LIRIIKHILQILDRREKRLSCLLIFLNFLISVADVASLALMLFVVNIYTGQTLNFHFRLPEAILDRHSMLLISAFLLFFSLKSVAGYFVLKFQYRFVYSVASRISHGLLMDFLEGSYEDHVGTDSSVLIKKISHQPAEFVHYVLAGVQQIITESLLVVLTATAILFFNAKLFFLLLMLMLPPFFLLTYGIRYKLQVVRGDIKKRSEKVLQYLQESLSGFMESNLYGKNDYFSRRYSTQQQWLNGHLADLQINQGISVRVIEVFAILSLFILIATNALLGHGSLISFTTIAAFIAGAYKIIPGVVRIINANSHVRDYEFTIEGLISEKGQKMTSVPGAMTKIHSVSFQNLCFEREKNRLLNEINLDTKKGEFIGLSGVSGRGKTTLIHLLLGFYKPSFGKIIINGLICDSEYLRNFWKDISYLKQQTFLIHDSVLNNIVLGENNYDKDRLDAAIARSGLQETLHKFPFGLDTIVTENGKNISGGQRQRIAIARALYKNAGLIIMDEPFNGLDEGSSDNILRHLRALANEGRIVLLITHNRQAISYCDKILYLNEQQTQNIHNTYSGIPG
jgi:ABC-type multidrug transport system fused ATPase/permease subunit